MITNYITSLWTFKEHFNDIPYEDGSYEYAVDEELCIGCGFCAGICPCGIWEMVENI